MPAGRPRNDRQLEHCRETGACCKECVSGCARSLAAVTAALTSLEIRQIFNAIYPQPECLPMANVFVQVVQAEKHVTARKPARSENVYELSEYKSAVA
jgi:hypothetical protein